jgi:hypothetical protein
MIPSNVEPMETQPEWQSSTTALWLGRVRLRLFFGFVRLNHSLKEFSKMNRVKRLAFFSGLENERIVRFNNAAMDKPTSSHLGIGFAKVTVPLVIGYCCGPDRRDHLTVLKLH